MTSVHPDAVIKAYPTLRQDNGDPTYQAAEVNDGWLMFNTIVLPQGRISLDHGIGMDTGHVSHRADGPGTTDEDACLALCELSQ